MGGTKRYNEQIENFRAGRTSDKKSDSFRVLNRGNIKEIYSYNTPIAFEGKDKNIYMTKQKYSQTTSTQQGVIRNNLKPIELEPSEFEKKRMEMFN